MSRTESDCMGKQQNKRFLSDLISDKPHMVQMDNFAAHQLLSRARSILSPSLPPPNSKQACIATTQRPPHFTYLTG